MDRTKNKQAIQISPNLYLISGPFSALVWRHPTNCCPTTTRPMALWILYNAAFGVGFLLWLIVPSSYFVVPSSYFVVPSSCCIPLCAHQCIPCVDDSKQWFDLEFKNIINMYGIKWCMLIFMKNIWQFNYLSFSGYRISSICPLSSPIAYVDILRSDPLICLATFPVGEE